MEEIWKQIKNYEGLYEVSNMGRVRSLPRKTTKGKIISPNVKKNGYLTVSLFKDGKQNYKLIHRLVAEAFIDNPENKSYIDHVNTIKNDNRAENLRWVTQKENMNNPLTLKKINENETIKKGFWKGCFGKDNPRSTPIIQLTLDGKIVQFWASAAVCKKETGFSNSIIGEVCKGKRKEAYGYLWRYS